jgi:hypothetical protein
MKRLLALLVLVGLLSASARAQDNWRDDSYRNGPNPAPNGSSTYSAPDQRLTGTQSYESGRIGVYGNGAIGPYGNGSIGPYGDPGRGARGGVCVGPNC